MILAGAAPRQITNESLEKKVELYGKWECFGKTLDLMDLSKKNGVEVDFPHLWSGQVIGKDTLYPLGYATYRLELQFEEGHPPASLMIDDMFTSYRLYVNGVLVSANGKVATSVGEYEPGWVPSVVDLPVDTNRYELILQLANFLHSKGGIKEPILLGTTDSIRAYDLQKKAYSLMLTGSLILGGLFFMGLFWFGRHDKAMLYFSLFCLVYTYRIIGTDYYVLHQLLPDLPWSVGLHLEYLSLFLSVLFFALFLFYLFPEDTNERVIWVLSSITILMMILTLITPPIFFTRLILYFIYLLLGMILYGFWVFLRAYKNKREGSQYGILSLAVVLIVVAGTISEYFRWYVPTDAFFFFGYIAFFFSQSLILSYRFSLRLRNSALLAQQADQAKIEFLSTISHELRTPLNAISGLTRLLSDNQPRPDQVDFLKSIKLSANNLLALVTDILDFSKIEQGKIELDHSVFYLEDVFSQVINNYSNVAAENGLEFHFEVDDHFKGLRVKSDQTRINQVLNNLIANAIKFTNHGYVGLRAEWLEETVEEVRFLVEVEDTGVGIAQDMLEKIFYQFTQESTSTTREYGGMGLGLTIVRNVLTAMGSKITVASTQGEGSRFTFEMTLQKDTRAITKSKIDKVQSTIADEVSMANRKILIAEDDLMNSIICQQYLKAVGIEPVLCQDGKEAVELTKNQHFDLILMDMHMPVMDGYQATRLILEDDPNQKIIALTGSVSDQAYNGLQKLGFFSVLTKPFKQQELLDAVQKAING